MHHRNYPIPEVERHLKEDHEINPIKEYLREIVYGGNDGIVTTFAVVASFAGAHADEHTLGIGTAAVLLFGFGNLLGDGASMGLGNFLSIRSDKKLYRQQKKKEMFEIHHHQDFEHHETEYILREQGYSEEDAHNFALLIAKNPDIWSEFMMKYEFKMQNPEGENPFLAGIATFISFVIFGFIPLIPYIVFPDHANTFIIAILFTTLALSMLATLRWWVTKEHLLTCIGETLSIGGAAATVAYLVGTFF